MRRSFNGLGAIIANQLAQDALSGHVFVFCNRRKNRIKVYYWDGSGTWACAKKLEQGTFWWPSTETESVELSHDELVLLLGGLDLVSGRRRNWYLRGQPVPS